MSPAAKERRRRNRRIARRLAKVLTCEAEYRKAMGVGDPVLEAVLKKIAR